MLACLDVSNIRNILKCRLLGHSVELLGVTVGLGVVVIVNAVVVIAALVIPAAVVLVVVVVVVVADVVIDDIVAVDDGTTLVLISTIIGQYVIYRCDHHTFWT